MRLKHISLFLFFSLLIWSCRENSDHLITVVDKSYDPVETSLTGRVMSSQGLPVPDVKVETGSLSRTTDANGMFSFAGISANGNGQTAWLEKSGYVPAILHYLPHQDGLHFNEGRMYRLDISTTFEASNGNQVFSNQFGRLKVLPHSVEDAFSRDYSGLVTVNAKVFDPSSGFDFLRGSYTARSLDNSEVFLEPTAAIYFDLVSPTQSKLSLGRPATWTMNGAVARGQSLWQYDKQFGIWQEITSLETTNELTIGQTGFYMIASKNNIRTLKTTVSLNGAPLSGVKIKIESGAYEELVWTDAAGTLRANLPAGAGAELFILNPCDQIIATAFVPESSEKIQVFDVVLPSTTPSVRIKGKVLDCGMNPFSEGYLKVNDLHWLTPNFNGQFDHTIIHCGSPNVVIQAFNLNEKKSSIPQTYKLSQQVIDMGNISVCDQNAGEFLKYILNGNECIISSPTVTITAGKDSIIIQGDHPDYQSPAGTPEFKMIIDNTTPGDHIIEYFEVYYEGYRTYHARCDYGCDLNIDLINSGNQFGNYVIGKFSGNIPWVGQSGELSISGEFSVLKQ